jgi:steroid delta-isomerase-like uncharacterized protein
VSQANGEIVRQMIAAWSNHDATKAVGLLAERVEYWDLTQPAPFKSRTEVKKFFQSYFDAFPNVSYEVLRIFTNGDEVACEWRMRLTQKSEMEGVNGVGKSVDLIGASLCTVVNSKITRQMDFWDSGTMLRQLGGTA